MMLSRISFFSFLSFLISCSKNNTTTNTPPQSNCKIIAASAVSGTGATIANFTYQYNSDGTLAGSLEMSDFPDTVSYKYDGKTIYRSVAAGSNSSVDTITLNDAGMEIRDKAQIGATVYVYTYSYDVHGLLTNFTQQQDAYPPVSATYTYTNGDNTGTAGGNYADTLVYDVSKPAVMGNLDQFDQYLSFGAMHIKNKHLIIEDHHGDVTYYTYTFTPEGNIATLKLTTGTSSETISYTYDCK